MIPADLEVGAAVMIKWVDSANNSTGWVAAKTKDFQIGNPLTVGLYLGRTEDRVAITHSLCEEHAYDIFTIPIGCIIEIKELYAVKEQAERDSAGK